ncbi:hypothetical protein WA026_015270 [Henosepilachna vigintioctopunctata]|uniref:CID domain-containing protein n=1 Tax=Henosepilachna vigintioctopunctata TaxID=420089 RepID=A0AAW1TL33_9CUCU
MNNKELFHFASALDSLVLHSKILINILTSMADKYAVHAEEIVRIIEVHLFKVEPFRKLLTMYLIDSILREVGGIYKNLIEPKIAAMFSSAFQRIQHQFDMIRLRNSWEGIFSEETLEFIDAIIAGTELNVFRPSRSYLRNDEMEYCYGSSSDDDDTAYFHVNTVKRFRKSKISPRKPSEATSKRLSESNWNNPGIVRSLQSSNDQSTSMDVDSFPVCASFSFNY